MYIYIEDRDRNIEVQVVETLSRVLGARRLTGWCGHRSKEDQGYHWMANTMQHKKGEEFVDLCSYYCRFVCGFTDIAGPLHQIVAFDEFHLSNECASAFETLK